MSTGVIFLGWNRAVPGREREVAALFQESLQYLGKLQQGGAIESFEVVLLGPHGGDLNGFQLIRGDPAKLGAVLASDEWAMLTTRGGLLLEGLGCVTGVTGEGVAKWMALWTQSISG